MQLNLIITRLSDAEYWTPTSNGRYRCKAYDYRIYKGKLQPLQPNERALTVKAKAAILNDIGSFSNMNDTAEEIFRNFAGYYGLEITETDGK